MQKINYIAHDLQPGKVGKKMSERVLTGSDGSIWYTANHYLMFTRLKQGERLMTLEDLKKEYPFIDESEDIQTKYVLNGSQMYKEGEMLAETYKKFEFNDFAKYANYDGLIELLSPDYLSELAGLTIVIENINDMLANSDQFDVKRYFGMLSIVNDEWQKKSAGSFKVIVK